jgi:hypothetical protein
MNQNEILLTAFNVIRSTYRINPCSSGDVGADAALHPSHTCSLYAFYSRCVVYFMHFTHEDCKIISMNVVVQNRKFLSNFDLNLVSLICG